MSSARCSPPPVCLVFAVASLAVPTLAGAVTFTVNSVDDIVDALPGNGKCRTTTITGGVCTLRAAVQEANTLAGPDVIVLPAGTYVLAIPPSDTSAATGDLEVLEEVEISGAGPGLTTIDAGALDRVFEVAPVAGPTFPVLIQRLTLRNGSAAAGGGAILNYATLTLRNCVVTENTSGNSGGGGIKTATGSSLTVELCTISNNAEATSGGGGIAALGTASVVIRDSLIEGNTAALTAGGLSVEGTTTIERTTVRNNTANVPAGFTFSGGGGIVNVGLLTMRDSTISGNVSTFTGGGGLHNASNVTSLVNVTVSGNTAATQGGGVWHNSAGTVALYHSTVAGNSAASGGGIWAPAVYPGNYTLLSATVVANNTGGNCSGLMSSWFDHHNLDSGTTCGLSGSGNLSSTDPLLGPLADNGGPVQTRALLPGSPAIDAATAACNDPEGGPLTADARGAARPLDGNGDASAACDIGAHEHFAGTDLIFADGFES